jgi:hypothetical protein
MYFCVFEFDRESKFLWIACEVKKKFYLKTIRQNKEKLHKKAQMMSRQAGLNKKKGQTARKTDKKINKTMKASSDIVVQLERIKKEKVEKSKKGVERGRKERNITKDKRKTKEGQRKKERKTKRHNKSEIRNKERERERQHKDERRSDGERREI